MLPSSISMNIFRGNTLGSAPRSIVPPSPAPPADPNGGGSDVTGPSQPDGGTGGTGGTGDPPVVVSLQ